MSENLTVDQTVRTWAEVFSKLYKEVERTGAINPEMVVPFNRLPSPKEARLVDFNNADLMSLNKGAEIVHRDNRVDYSLQVRTYEDGEADIMDENSSFEIPVYHVQLDGHNPKKGVDEAVAHFFHDVAKVRLPIPHGAHDDS